MNDMRMARLLRERREYLGFSQEQVARALGMSRPSLTQVENGKRSVKAEELAKLAKIYQMPPGYFDGSLGAELSHATLELLKKASHLHPQDLAEVTRFADYLHWRGRRNEVHKPEGEDAADA